MDNSSKFSDSSNSESPKNRVFGGKSTLRRVQTQKLKDEEKTPGSTTTLNEHRRQSTKPISRLNKIVGSATSLNSGRTREFKTHGFLAQNLPNTIPQKIIFVIFFPTYAILYLLMPNIHKKPDVSKILLSSILIILFSFLFCYLIYRIEFMLILVYKVKVHLIGLLNGILFSFR